MAEIAFAKANNPGALHLELLAAGVSVTTCYQGDEADELIVMLPDEHDTPTNRQKVEAAVRAHDPARVQADRDRAANERREERDRLASLTAGTAPLTTAQLTEAVRLLARATLRGAP